ncbi:MAG: hypothetical protein HYY24_17110 [Verrucomicrobia bacterium]|nr:hypothetical protein [Verrucomicrobiota bacterium]
MVSQIKMILLVALPAIAFVTFLIASRLLAGSKAVPAWVDWALVMGSAALVVFNPLVKHLEAAWSRGLALAVGFVVWVIILFILTFWVLFVVFSEAL